MVGKSKRKAQKKRLALLKEILEVIALITGILAAVHTILKG